MKTKHKLKILLLCCLAVQVSCSNDNDNVGTQAESYDPNLPVLLLDFMPDSGRIREKVIIKGSNFGNDKSKVSVYFYDGYVDRKATIIGVDNNTIYCLAPRQEPGHNTIKVLTSYEDSDTIAFPAERTFSYSQAENVTTISGSTSTAGTDDGTLAEAKFSYIFGVGAIGNEAILVFQRDNASVRYVSVPEDRVITVHKGFQGGKPAVTKDKNTVYAVQWVHPHVVYRYARETGWSPMRIGQISTPFSDRIRSVCFYGDNEDYLYFVDGGGKFGRYALNAQVGEDPVEVIANPLKDTQSGQTIALHSDRFGHYMLYNHFDGYFYFSTQANSGGIYKMKMEFDENGKPQVTELITYAGFKSGGVLDGYLDECQFVQPNGMTLDELGNIFIVEGFAVSVLRKISTVDGYVSTVAGKVTSGNGEQKDGLPSVARFCSPYDIANDGEGNYWIVESWGAAVRKYAVE
jgi:sugar lactone lactonase YvrE